MIYEWKCKKCGEHREVERSIENSSAPPDGLLGEMTVDYAKEGGCANLPGYKHDWVRVYSSSVPFQTLRHHGVFMDQYGNYPPRNV